MFKFFKTITGKNYACDEKGVLAKNSDELPVELDSTEGMEEVTVESEAEAELAKMLGKAGEKSAQTIEDLRKEASASIKQLFSDIASDAKSSKAPVSNKEEEESYVKNFTEAVKNFVSGKSSTLLHTFGSEKELNAIATKSTSESGSLTGDVIVPDRDPAVERPAVRTVFIEQIANSTPMSSDTMSYVEVVTQTGAPATTAELAEIPEKDFEFEEFRASLKKIGVSNKHSKELLSDAPQLVNAIKGWLKEDLNLKVDEQLLSGTGTGTNLNGIFTIAPAFNPAGRTVANPNLYDVLRMSITQIMVAGKGKFIPNYILLHPADAEALDLVKDAEGRYVLPPFSNSDGTVIKGVRVIMNTGITLGNFLVGDFRKLHVGYKGGVEMEVTNSDGTDFKKDIITVKLTRRLASYVRGNDNGAFVTDTIADAITAITA